MKVLIALCLLCLAPLASMAEDSSGVGTFYDPYPLDPGATVVQIGASLTILPPPLYEDEYPIPAIDLQLRHGLSRNWSLVGSFSTNVFSNLLHGGPQWNTNIDRFSVALATHIGGFAGFITAAGQFDQNRAYAVFALPIVRAGYRIDEFSLSASSAVSYIFASASDVSGLDASGPTGTFNDFYVTIAAEQPLLKRTRIALGISLNYSRTPYQTWMFYNTIDEYLFLPEFFFAVKL